MRYAVQLIDGTGHRREWRITGEMYNYILGIIKESDHLLGIFEVEPGEH